MKAKSLYTVEVHEIGIVHEAAPCYPDAKHQYDWWVNRSKGKPSACIFGREGRDKGKRVTLLRDGVVVKEFIPPSEVTLILGHVYRGKKVRVTGFITPVYDDRSIMYLDQDVVQFDHPSLRNGKHYSKTTRARFIAWAARDVTDQCPPGEWISVRAVTCTNHGKA